MKDGSKKAVLLGSIGTILCLYFLAWDALLLGRPFVRALLSALGKGVAWTGLCAGMLVVGARNPVIPPLRVRAILVNALAALACLGAGLALEAWISDLSVEGRGIFGAEPTFPVLARDHLPSALLVVATLVLAQQYLMAAFRGRQRDVDNARMEVSLVRAKHQALMNRLEPHFLFNALNSVHALVRPRPEAAERMIVQLGDLLRAALDSESTPLVPLGQEIRLLETYLDIERTRFQDRLRTRVEVPPGLEGVPVPQFVLQPLVENCLKHGIGPRAEGGWVEVRAGTEGDALVLTVEDDGGGCGDVREGIGLSSTRARLDLLFPGRAALEVGPRPGGGTRARVRLPLA